MGRWAQDPRHSPVNRRPYGRVRATYGNVRPMHVLGKVPNPGQRKAFDHLESVRQKAASDSSEHLLQGIGATSRDILKQLVEKLRQSLMRIIFSKQG